MLEAIEKLLILQDRDRSIMRLRGELANIGPEREAAQSKTRASQARLDSTKLRGKQIESERKKLELEVEDRKQAIEKYSLQQFQTRKNEEYRALAHEIEMAREAIVKLEDEELELMEQAEAAQKEVVTAVKLAETAKNNAGQLIAELAEREENLSRELAQLEANRDQLAAEVDEDLLPRYERLRRSKGATAVVGVAHGVCGGCHMKLPVQIVVSCQGDQDIVNCPNCGRILYYTRDMDLAVAD